VATINQLLVAGCRSLLIHGEVLIK